MSENFLITGAARGIGRGLTRHLLSKGHRVFIFDNNEHELTHLKAQLPKWFPRSESARWQIMQGSLTNPADVSLAADSASVFFDGHLDVLINNGFAGPVGATPFARLSFDEWNTMLQTNLTGSMLMTQSCLPLLSRQTARADGSRREYGGSVIMMSSTRARQSEPNSEGYAVTKAGLIGLTHALACSLADDGVSVNAVLPGWINVVSESREGDEKGWGGEHGLSEEDKNWHWTGRVGTVEDVLRAVEYLVGAGGFVTGIELVVDGGVSRRMVYPE